MSVLEIIGATLCALGFVISYQLDRIRAAVEMTEKIERERLYG